MEETKLFISYAHKDESYKDSLMVALSPLRRRGLIKIWEDRQIASGSKWNEVIEKELRDAHIILLLISSDFINSDFCYTEELGIAMAQSDEQKALMIPVFIRPCDFSHLPFGAFQGVPRNAKPVSVWDNEDEAWLDVAQELKRTVEQIQAGGVLKR